MLQASSYWREGEPLRIDLAAGQDLAARLAQDKATSRRQLGNQLAAYLPQRLAEVWLQSLGLDAALPMPQLRDRQLAALAAAIRTWQVVPDGSEGWRKAEVTAGGVDTRELNQQTMESRLQPGLHFIGEVTDVTGWLGGYNFQWAWASAAACATALAART